MPSLNDSTAGYEPVYSNLFSNTTPKNLRTTAYLYYLA